MKKLVFRNYGGSYQLAIRDAGDLEAIGKLDEALWAVTSIPIKALTCDKKFSDYLDTDNNGRIRTDEFKAAQQWLFRILKNYTGISQGSGILNFSDINIDIPEGQKLKAAAERILKNINASNREEITLAQVRNSQSIMASSNKNGDGIITSEGVNDTNLSEFITTVIQAVGSLTDASGKEGISQEQLTAFFQQASAFIEWKKKGEIPQGKETTEIMVWGNKTPQAFSVLSRLENKIDQYFLQCAMVKFDEQAAVQMKLRQKELDEMDFSNESQMQERLKNAPIAQPHPKGVLDLDGEINSIFVKDLSELQETVLSRFENSATTLSHEQWNAVKTTFAAYRSWIKTKPVSKIENLDIQKVTAYLDCPYGKQVTELIQKDLAVAQDLQQIGTLEKLILYQHCLLELSNNFVSFSNIYDPSIRSLFEAGTLIIDGRKMTFTMRVQDHQAHKKIATDSLLYLLYAEITNRQDKDLKFEIVAAVTSGTTGRLLIGKRGIFIDRDSKEWDAQITDIVVHPISLIESVKAPFQKIGALIAKQGEKLNQKYQTKIEQTVVSGPSPSSAARDILIGGGLAVAALGSSFAYIADKLSKLKYVNILHALIALIVIVIIILIPNIIMGFIRLRKRNLSIILEAADCAVNAHMRLSTSLGMIFTQEPPLPKGSHKQRKDLIALFAKNLGPARSKKKLVLIIVIGIVLISLAYFFSRTCVKRIIL